MTKKELILALTSYDEDTIVICKDDNGCWDNILQIEPDGSLAAIIFGGGTSFTDE